MTKLIVLILSIFVLNVSRASDKLQIDIYYESLCPDSIRFITNQLYPVFKSIDDYVNIRFIPFGKAESINGGESFECQHGEKECYGNKIQSCVLHQLGNNQQLQVRYVACQMRFEAQLSGEECAAFVGVDFDNVSECYSSGLGTKLQLEAERLTNLIRPSFVPTIVYNNDFNQKLQDRSLTGFLSVVCTLINGIAPVCQNY